MADLKHVTGFKALSDAMKEFAPAVQAQLMRPAVGAATEVVRQQAQDDAPYYHGKVQEGHPPPGTLKRAIQRKFLGQNGTRTQWIAFVRKGRSARYTKVKLAQVGPMPAGVKRHRFTEVQNQDAFYWFWVNFGTAKMDRVPFMSDALPKTVNQAIDAMRESLTKGLKRLQVKGMKR